MFKKLPLFAAAAFALCGLASCGGSDQTWEQNSDVPQPETINIGLVGTPTEWADGADLAFTKLDSSHYQLKDFDLQIGDEFKFRVDGTWATQFGVEDMDWSKSTQGLVDGVEGDYNEGTSNRSNFKSLLAGKMTVDYYPYYFIDGLAKPFVITVA